MLRDILKSLCGDLHGASVSKSNQNLKRASVRALCVVEGLEGRELLSQGLVPLPAGPQAQVGSIHALGRGHQAPAHHQAPVHHQAARGHHQAGNGAASFAQGTPIVLTPTTSIQAPPSTAAVQVTPSTGTQGQQAPQVPNSQLSWHYVGTAQIYTPAIQYAGYTPDQVTAILKQSGLSDTQTQDLLNGKEVVILDTTDNNQAQDFMSSYIIPSVVQVHYSVETY